MIKDTLNKTKNHNEIKKWVIERGGHPAVVKDTMTQIENEIGELKIDFPGYTNESDLSRISWDTFFKTFENKGFVFLYENETPEGNKSIFYEIANLIITDSNAKLLYKTTDLEENLGPISGISEKELEKMSPEITDEQ